MDIAGTVGRYMAAIILMAAVLAFLIPDTGLWLQTKGINYLLDAQTLIGAQISRLEMDHNNITIQSENVQASESILRDADMAKEMTNYAKANVLTQASQAMLAQANQNSSQVLSLLS